MNIRIFIVHVMDMDWTLVYTLVWWSQGGEGGRGTAIPAGRITLMTNQLGSPPTSLPVKFTMADAKKYS